MNPSQVALLLLCMAAMVSIPALAQASTDPSGVAHTRTEFQFVVDAPFEKAAPLFGANEERKWAPDWNPQFVYPLPAHDQEGMIFRVAHGQLSSIWTNTAFDLAGGHIQYAYVLSDAMTTLIDIHLTRDGAGRTGVRVVYERTALTPDANEHVEHFAKGDAKAGKEWADAINRYFEKQRGAEQPKYLFGVRSVVDQVGNRRGLSFF